MNLATELSHAALRARAMNEQLPEPHRLDLDAEWSILQDELDASRSDGGRELALIEWRQRVERRLTARLAHAPLTLTPQPQGEPDGNLV